MCTFPKLYFHTTTNQVEPNQLLFAVTRNCSLITVLINDHRAILTK